MKKSIFNRIMNKLLKKKELKEENTMYTKVERSKNCMRIGPGMVEKVGNCVTRDSMMVEKVGNCATRNAIMVEDLRYSKTCTMIKK